MQKRANMKNTPNISIKAENDGNIETEINYDVIGRDKSLTGYNRIVIPKS
ncbi:hypothetical protein [Floccifex sp.]